MDNKTVREELDYYFKQYYFNEKEQRKINKLMDVKIIKKFSLNGQFWFSWQIFGKHKNVINWWLLENRYAIGFNENPATGWSFPIKKLSKEVFEIAKNHTKNYEEYYNIN